MLAFVWGDSPLEAVCLPIRSVELLNYKLQTSVPPRARPVTKVRARPECEDRGLESAASASSPEGSSSLLSQKPPSSTRPVFSDPVLS